MGTSSARYNNIAVLLHWLIALAIIFQLGLGWRMVDEPKGAGAYALFQLHKSIGFSILFLSVFRVFWRLTHKAPELPNTMPQWEQLAAKLAHLAFYGIMLGLPLTGWLLVSASSTNIPTVLFGVVPFPHLPLIAELSTDIKYQLHELAEVSHALLAIATMGLLLLHIGAVLKHQLIVKDVVFSHMAVGAKAGWGEWRLWLILASVPVVFMSAWWYPTPKPATPAAQQSPMLTADLAPIEEDITPTPDTPVIDNPKVEAVKATEQLQAIVEEKVENTEPVIWQVNAKKSRLGFVSSWSGEQVLGEFTDWQAEIVFAENALEKSHIEVKVNLAKVTTGDSQRDEALPTADWFNAEQYPQAVFKSNKIISKGTQRYQAQGTLSLKNVTQKVNLDFVLNIKDKQAKAQGTAQLDRTVFGVGQGEWAATDSIPAMVKVTFALQATAK
ncbi:MAG: YceI family protein [Moraxellaceae bacterium]|nr:YceI family protein [Moraxellaceae bacterium]